MVWFLGFENFENCTFLTQFGSTYEAYSLKTALVSTGYVTFCDLTQLQSLTKQGLLSLFTVYLLGCITTTKLFLIFPLYMNISKYLILLWFKNNCFAYLFEGMGATPQFLTHLFSEKSALLNGISVKIANSIIFRSVHLSLFNLNRNYELWMMYQTENF